MNVNSNQTTTADLSATPQMTAEPAMASANTQQPQSILGTTQGLLSDLSRCVGHPYYPPYMPSPPYSNNQQTMIGMVQQMLQMLMRMMMQMIGQRPQQGNWAQQTMLGMMQQMMNTLMQTLRDLLRRPQMQLGVMPPNWRPPPPPPRSYELLPFKPTSRPPTTIMPVDPGWNINRLVGMQVDQAQLRGREVGASEVRVIYPGVPQTRDYRADRLNLMVDQSGLVTRAYKG